MNEEGLEKIQENTLDWVSDWLNDWLNHDNCFNELKDKLGLYLSPDDLNSLVNGVIDEVWCEMEFKMTDAIVEWCENRYKELNE